VRRPVRGGWLLAIGCLVSPCCAPLLVPIGLALLAGSPIAAWLTVHLDWVYGALTLLSALSIGLGIWWLTGRREPATGAAYRVEPSGPAQVTTDPAAQRR
jgi:hypothetical protein